MSNSSTIDRSPADGPPAPDVCDDCGNTDFTPRSKPPANTSGDDTNEYVFAFHECSECGSRYNDRSSQLLEPENVRTPDWEEIFGHPEPYEHQADGIQHVIDTALDSGYTVMEGGCGTGKTMIALTAGLRLVKDPRTKFERIMVLTSVKQQLRQFEDDLKIINRNLPEDIPEAKAVTLVGKTDLCPYAREEQAGLSKDNVAKECRTLRDKTSQLMSDGLDGTELARNAVPQSDFEEWTSSGAQAPYSNEIPTAKQEYCPFYANYKEHKDPLFTFGHAEDCILHPDEIVKQAVQKGVCPHSAMSTLCRDAEVVIANYYHAFDQNTLQITHPLIDETTLLVCDEAHMLEPRVRGILSQDVQAFQIERAAEEIAAVYNAASSDTLGNPRVRQPPRAVATEKLGSEGMQPDILAHVYSVLQNLSGRITTSITDFLDENHSAWRQNPSAIDSRVEIPLRDPGTGEPDAITDWADDQNIPESFWRALPSVAGVVEDTLSEGSDDAGTDYAVTDVADLFKDWFERDHTTYFREITLTKTESTHPNDEGWERVFDASVELHSVMPRGVISGTLEQFGAGLLMSATLEPIDVYREVTGLNYLSTMKNLRVTERAYSADFPEEKRLSLTLDVPKFTYGNRGDISDDTETRTKYARGIQAVAKTTPGNVLVCMPSYREARWAASLIEQTSAISKDVLLDQSSGEEATQQLKEEFYAGEAKVLVTSLRGTLTEGVDFDGDKLLGCIVCGVPIENVGSPKTQALRTAYEDQFGGIGFDYGLTVPAVRKTRQALGRVIRGTEDVGVRVLADKRYAGVGRNSVRHYLSEDEQSEYEVVEDMDTFGQKLQSFWQTVS